MYHLYPLSVRIFFLIFLSVINNFRVKDSFITHDSLAYVITGRHSITKQTNWTVVTWRSVCVCVCVCVCLSVCVHCIFCCYRCNSAHSSHCVEMADSFCQLIGRYWRLLPCPPPQSPRFTFLYISYTQRYFRIAKMPDISRCNNYPNICHISEQHLSKSRPSRTPVEHRQLQPPQKRLAICL